jgi:hypothetical protein
VALDTDAADVLSTIAKTGKMDDAARADLIAAITRLAASLSDKKADAVADPKAPDQL